jgi:hypothetical protein
VKTCETCQAKFEPARSFQTWCSPECAFKIARKKLKEKAEQKKLERQLDRKQREKLKKRSKLIAEARDAFNAWIRYRDRGQLCIDCNQPMGADRPGGAIDAGHYLSVGSAPHLRFHEDNVHAQRKNCNRSGGSTRDAYRAGLIDRIGIERVEALEADQTSRKYTADDLRAIRDEYRARLRSADKPIPATSMSTPEPTDTA